MNKDEVKQLWGVEFHVVPQGLDEGEVVSYVDGVRADQARQASLQKLAEQTVVEADKLAEGIKKQARQEAEEEASRIVAAAEQQAQEQVQRLINREKKNASDASNSTIAKAETDAQEIVESAKKKAELIVQGAREQVPGIESQAKLEAEYVVRKFTVGFVEQIRSVVNETANNMIPSLDGLLKESGYPGALEEVSTSKPAIAASTRGKTRASSKRS